MRTICVTGKGQIKAKPDMTRITITLEGLFKDYGETLWHSSEDTEELKDVLSGFDFERTNLKTLNFSVDMILILNLTISMSRIQSWLSGKSDKKGRDTSCHFRLATRTPATLSILYI